MNSNKQTMMVQLGVIILALALLAPGCNNSEKPQDYPENPNSGDKVLVWSDEFDYNGLPDSKKWSYDTDGNSGGWGNNELQFYTASRLKNAEVKDGFLTITAHKEDYEGFKYTSARLVTRQKGDWLYGRVEVKAKIPDGRGTWPAIWMLPTDWQYGGWPSSGEIDIMESVGYDPYKIVGTVHTEAYNHSIGTQKGATTTVQTCYSDFHLYVLEWDLAEIRIFVDDLLYFTFRNDGTGYKTWPFDKRFHLLLNVAVGGNWGGAQGVDDSIFPKTMVIDYVRIYQKK